VANLALGVWLLVVWWWDDYDEILSINTKTKIKMTLIISWINKENDPYNTIWTIGDTKISNEDNRDSTLTLNGSKVLELPLRCKNLTSTIQEVYFNTKLTFAYAGSSLTALNTYCTLYAIFTNLGGLREHNTLPDYQSISRKAAEILEKYFQEIGSPTAILIAGFCPKNKLPFQAKITLKMNTDIIKPHIEYLPSSNSINCLLLGNNTTEIESLILEKINNSSNDKIDYWRIPKNILNEIIEKRTYPSIGGNIQLAINNPIGFNLYSICAPIKGEEPKATLKFRNFDIFEELGTNVGDCTIAINGMV